MVTRLTANAALKAICKATWVTPKHSIIGLTRIKVLAQLWSIWTLKPFNLISFLFEFCEKFLGSICILEEFFCLSRSFSFCRCALDRLASFISRRRFGRSRCGCTGIGCCCRADRFDGTLLLCCLFGGGGGVGIALALIGITGCAMDSLSDEEETSSVFFCFSTDVFIELLNLSQTSARSRSIRSSSEVFGGPRDRSFGVEVSRTGLVVLALAWRKLLRNGAT